MKKLMCGTLAILMIALTVPAHGEASPPTDRVALQGVKVGKAVFDVNLSDPEKLPLYLQVIKETHGGLKQQGVKPAIVIAFRGAAVRLVSTNRSQFTPEQRESLEEGDKLVGELAKLGVRFEACAVATRLFNVDNRTIHPAVMVVGNTFNSLIGYQAKGYALIPIQ